MKSLRIKFNIDIKSAQCNSVICEKKIFDIFVEKKF
jgi:hypothetical protein